MSKHHPLVNEKDGKMDLTWADETIKELKKRNIAPHAAQSIVNHTGAHKLLDLLAYNGISPELAASPVMHRSPVNFCREAGTGPAQPGQIKPNSSFGIC